MKFGRARAVFDGLLNNLRPEDQAEHVAQHLKDLEDAIDRVLVAIEMDPRPTSPLRSGEIKQVTTPSGEPVPPPASRPKSKRFKQVGIFDAQDAGIEEAVARADVATVPGAIRSILERDAAGLLPRQIVAAVLLVRPATDEAAVHGALHQMRKRGEIAREGIHRNYRYRLIVPPAIKPPEPIEGRGPGGEPH
ncbi:MAG: hypothetical protein IPJ34_12675 [Myxococcales bacterium]|nr:hypothetical protein [Myxococcales bacterium]